MRIKTMSLVLLLLFAPVFLMPDDGQEEGMHWLSEYSEAKSLAKEQGKPILIFFNASWSAPSQKMNQLVWKDEKVISLSKRYICVSVDIEHHPGLATEFRVTTFPGVIFTDPWGNEMFRRVGYISADYLRSVMKVYPSDFSELIKLKGVLEKDKKNYVALNKAAEFYLKGKVWEMSNYYYKKALETREALADAEKKKRLIQGIAINELRMRNYEDAMKAFQQFLKDFPASEETHKFLYGLFIAYIGLRKVEEAHKILEKLKSEYPNLPTTKQAEKILESLERLRKKKREARVRKK